MMFHVRKLIFLGACAMAGAASVVATAPAPDFSSARLEIMISFLLWKGRLADARMRAKRPHFRCEAKEYPMAAASPLQSGAPPDRRRFPRQGTPQPQHVLPLPTQEVCPTGSPGSKLELAWQVRRLRRSARWAGPRSRPRRRASGVESSRTVGCA